MMQESVSMTWRSFLIDWPARAIGYVLSPAYLPTRWDRFVPRLLHVPWILLKTYLVVAAAIVITVYYAQRPSPLQLIRQAVTASPAPAATAPVMTP
jgi:hypothetical protein